MKKSFLLCSLFMSFLFARAQWNSDPSINTLVAQSSGAAIIPQMVSDGYGGAFIAWDDYRNGTYATVYIQHVDYQGMTLWMANGIAASALRSSLYGIIQDGNGGFIVAWQDVRNGPGQVYAQKFNANGVAQWTSNGILVSPTIGGTPVGSGPALITSDGAGGAIIAWNQLGSDFYSDIYAQRISNAGTLLWNINGVPITTAIYSQEITGANITSDGSNGAILVWTDARSYDHNDIYAQRILSSGSTAWNANGVLVAAGGGTRYFAQSPEIIYDGSGGAYITWERYDEFFGINEKYANRINNTGNLQWTSPGIKFTSPYSSGYGQRHQIINNGLNELIVTWLENRGLGTQTDVYVQKFDQTGNKQWGVDGVALSVFDNIDVYLRMVTDNAGGAIISWQNFESGDPDRISANLYARRIDVNGVPLGLPSAIPVSTAPGRQHVFNLTMISNGYGGAILGWDDARTGTNANPMIYVNHILNDAVLPVTFLNFTGKRKDALNLLSWSTATEQNNRGFEIQHSIDGNQFNTIGFVNGKRNSNNIEHYSFSHLLPNSGWNYYRLKQIDDDGHFHYSAVIKIDNSSGIIRVFPNPATDYITIETNTQRSIVEIIDPAGALIKKVMVDGNRQLNISSLPPGKYFCRFGNAVHSFIKL